MKNNNWIFFIIGIMIGGMLLLSVFVFQLLIKIPKPQHSIQPTGTESSNAPRLLALEPTRVVIVKPTQTVLPTIVKKPSATQTTISVSPTVTPLYLANKQEPKIIGQSVNGLPIEVYTFGKGEHERMIVADIHGGDEWNTRTLANQLIQYVNQYPRTIPDDVTLSIIPSLNPDGEVRAHNKLGHTNNNGIDLNRNFPINWQANWNHSGCWNYAPTSGGSAPGSEPETQALMGFIESHKIEALISYHSAALGIFPGGEPLDEASSRFAESIAEVSPYPYPPLDIGCVYTGTLADYAVSKGIAAVDLELTNHIDTDFNTNLDILNVLLTWER